LLGLRGEAVAAHSILRYRVREKGESSYGSIGRGTSGVTIVLQVEGDVESPHGATGGTRSGITMLRYRVKNK
jgi:hypothetical protein